MEEPVNLEDKLRLLRRSAGRRVSGQAKTAPPQSPASAHFPAAAPYEGNGATSSLAPPPHALTSPPADHHSSGAQGAQDPRTRRLQQHLQQRQQLELQTPLPQQQRPWPVASPLGERSWEDGGLEAPSLASPRPRGGRAVAAAGEEGEPARRGGHNPFGGGSRLARTPPRQRPGSSEPPTPEACDAFDPRAPWGTAASSASRPLDATCHPKRHGLPGADEEPCDSPAPSSPASPARPALGRGAPAARRPAPVAAEEEPEAAYARSPPGSASGPAAPEAGRPRNGAPAANPFATRQRLARTPPKQHREVADVSLWGAQAAGYAPPSREASECDGSAPASPASERWAPRGGVAASLAAAAGPSVEAAPRRAAAPGKAQWGSAGAPEAEHEDGYQFGAPAQGGLPRTPPASYGSRLAREQPSYAEGGGVKSAPLPATYAADLGVDVRLGGDPPEARRRSAAAPGGRALPGAEGGAGFARRRSNSQASLVVQQAGGASPQASRSGTPPCMPGRGGGAALGRAGPPPAVGRAALAPPSAAVSRATSGPPARSVGEEAAVAAPPASHEARDVGAKYLRRDELQPFPSPPTQRTVGEVVARLKNKEEWSVQFAALDDLRRLAAFAPAVLLAPGGSIGPVLDHALELCESPRSALARNGLRCLGELFVAAGHLLDAKLEGVIFPALRRAADTNHFIAEEADQALCEVCHAAGVGRLIGALTSAAAHKSPGIRSKAIWCLAMVAQRLGRKSSSCREMPALMQIVTKAVADASPDVRSAASAAAIALVVGDPGLMGRFASALPEGIDLASFDACDRRAIMRLHALRRGGGGGGLGAGLANGPLRPTSGHSVASGVSAGRGCRDATEMSAQWRKESEERRRTAGAAVVRGAAAVGRDRSVDREGRRR